jgi:hypothetical protein
MNIFPFGSRRKQHKCNADRNAGNNTQYLLGAEEQLLQSISDRVPLPKILNGLCTALDCQIGNVVSIISLAADEPSKAASMATNAGLFGLFPVCRERIVAENHDLLGTLEMYGIAPRHPSAVEFQCIERAKTLAAIAIKRHHEADALVRCGAPRSRPVHGQVFQWPNSTN